MFATRGYMYCTDSLSVVTVPACYLRCFDICFWVLFYFLYVLKGRKIVRFYHFVFPVVCRASVT